MVAFVAAGSNGTGSTSVDPGYPTVTAGDYIYMVISTRSGATIVAPGGVWTEIQAPFTGSSGMTTAVYRTISTGAETGTLTVSVTSGNSSNGKMVTYRPANNSKLTETVSAAADTTSSLDYTTTSGTLAVQNGDRVVAFVGIDDNGTFSARALTHSTASEGSLNQQFSFVNATGLDSHLEGNDILITSSNTGTVTMSLTSSTVVTGSTVFLVLHDVPNVSYPPYNPYYVMQPILVR